jgi:hypothetical protein
MTHLEQNTDLSNALIILGFESLDEYNELISNVDLTSQEQRSNFINWQATDGTKEGLLKLT